MVLAGLLGLKYDRINISDSNSDGESHLLSFLENDQSFWIGAVLSSSSPFHSEKLVRVISN